jgi:transposase-like protein
MWHPEEVLDDMPEVLAARDAYKKADRDALEMRFRARAILGLAVEQELKTPGQTQERIAKNLGVVAEQIRRYRQAYRDWLREHPGESLSA